MGGVCGEDLGAIWGGVTMNILYEQKDVFLIKEKFTHLHKKAIFTFLTPRWDLETTNLKSIFNYLSSILTR